MHLHTMKCTRGFLLAVLLTAALPAVSGAVDKAELFIFFKDLCDACHGANPTHNIESARAGYDLSGHKNNGHSFYANGNGCQKCHTHEGFTEFVETGTIDPESFVKSPSQPGCNTCHNPHKNGDLSLRKIDPVSLPSGKTFDLGKGNLCANCHQTRGVASETVKSLPAKDVPPYWGPHHGPQADMLIGANAYEFPGKSYYSSVHATLGENSCVDCHMAFPEGRFSFSPAMSGHSFSMAAEVHHKPKLNVTGCLGKCHKSMGQVNSVNEETPVSTFWWHQTEAVYDLAAKADFDNDGSIEPLQGEIEGLLNRFVNTSGTGYLQKGPLPLFNKDGAWNGTKSEQMRSQEEMVAFYNYKYVLEDRSRGIHNAPYTIQILYDTIQSLDPEFDVSKRNVYRPPEEYKPAG